MMYLSVGTKFFVLLLMLFLHIFDDYYLQGILASMKQKGWWTKQDTYEDKYKYDYIVALVCHAFSWTFMVMLPIFFVYGFELTPIMAFGFVIHWLVHGYTDNSKANWKQINLVHDQSIHMIQVFLLWLGFIMLGSV